MINLPCGQTQNEKLQLSNTELTIQAIHDWERTGHTAANTHVRNWK